MLIIPLHLLSQQQKYTQFQDYLKVRRDPKNYSCDYAIAYTPSVKSTIPTASNAADEAEISP